VSVKTKTVPVVYFIERVIVANCVLSPISAIKKVVTMVKTDLL
jgi:hypothetical protein